MRFAKTMQPDTCKRDAEMVSELQKNWLAFSSDKNKESLDSAVAWFAQKHNADWVSFVKPDDKREEGRGV